MRVRSRSTMAQTPNIAYGRSYPVSCANRTWSAYTYFNGVHVGTSEVCRDVSTPNFAKIRKQTGRFTFNPFDIERITSTSQGSACKYQTATDVCTNPNTPWFGGTDGDAFSYLLSTVHPSGLPAESALSDDEVSQLVAEVCTECHANVRAGESEGYEAIAQWRATVDMLRNPIKAVTDLISRKSDKRTGKALVQASGSQYLAFRYGIKPFISDIQNIIKTATTDKVLSNHTARASRSISKESTRYSQLISYGQTLVILKYHTKHTFSVRAMSVNRYRASWLSDLGFMPDQIPMTLWNLIPLSFVSDWFVNIGTYLNAIVPRLGVDSLGSCYTMETNQITTVTVHSCVAKANHVVTTPMSGIATTNRLHRKRELGLVAPAITVKSDFRFEKPTRVLDALALASQVILKHTRKA